MRFTRSVARIEADGPAEYEAGPVYKKELERFCVLHQAQNERRPRRDDDNSPTRPHNYTTRQNAIDEAENVDNANSIRSEIQQLYPQSSFRRGKPFAIRDLCSKPLSADEFLIATRKQYADEIRDFMV